MTGAFHLTGGPGVGSAGLCPAPALSPRSRAGLLSRPRGPLSRPQRARGDQYCPVPGTGHGERRLLPTTAERSLRDIPPSLNGAAPENPAYGARHRGLGSHAVWEWGSELLKPGSPHASVPACPPTQSQLGRVPPRGWEGLRVEPGRAAAGRSWAPHSNCAGPCSQGSPPVRVPLCPRSSEPRFLIGSGPLPTSDPWLLTWPPGVRSELPLFKAAGVLDP